jgi:hypothetical protein
MNFVYTNNKSWLAKNVSSITTQVSKSNPDRWQQFCLLPSLLLYISPWIYSPFSQLLDCLAFIIQCIAHNKFFDEGVNCHVSCYFNIFLTKLFYKFSIMILKNIYFLYVKFSYFNSLYLFFISLCSSCAEI